ncbi:LIC12162 family protein [Alphaproteobacteria bacterium]|nr:LIC12162 family protein [Alphaproteobacteria bacterium]
MSNELCLIMTSDEKLWPKKKNVVFLGDWCKYYNRKHIWKKLKAVDAKPFIVSKKQFLVDHKYVNNIYEIILSRLVNILNKIHNKTFKKKDWESLVGHWLKRFLIVYFNRYKTIKLCLKNYNIDNVCFYPKNSFSLTTRNLEEFTNACNDPTWNAVFWQIIFLNLKHNICKINYVEKPEKSKISISTKSSKKLSIRRILENLSGYFSKNSKFMIIDSYLPKLFSFYLCISLRIFPQLWNKSNKEIKSTENKNMREKLNDLISSKTDDEFLKICTQILSKCIPISYLEGLKEIELNAEKRNFPKDPKVIFTSNAFFSDEEFKYWVINQRKKKVKYIIGQHGSNYGIERFHHPRLEEEIPDQFITWGENIYSKNVISGFVFTAPKNKIIKYNTKGNILLVELSPPFHIYHHDEFFRYKNYFKNQIKFFNHLDENQKKNVVIRLPGLSKKLHFNEIEKWKAINKNIRIDDFSCPIKEAISNSKIVVFSYFSTGFLECMCQNIPTIGFWNEPLYNVLKNSKNDFKKLMDANILHGDYKSASSHLNYISLNIDDWWYSDQVQQARNMFIKKYASIKKNPIRFLKNVIQY